MGLDLISGVFAAAATHWIINGLPIEAIYLKSASPGCVVAAQRATAWRKTGRSVAEQRVGQWCVVGTVIDRYWVSEQWRAESAGGPGAFGWRVRLPLNRHEESSRIGQPGWPLDLIDPVISARIQFRSSLDSLDAHHQKTLRLMAADAQAFQPDSMPVTNKNPLRISRLRNGALVVSGASAGTRYSIVIQRSEMR